MCQNRVISMKLQRNWLALKLFDAPLQHFRHWRQGCRIDICNPSFPLSFLFVWRGRFLSLALDHLFLRFDCVLSEGSFVPWGKLVEALNRHPTKPHFDKFNVVRSVSLTSAVTLIQNAKRFVNVWNLFTWIYLT